MKVGASECEQKDHNQQGWQPLVGGGWGRVEGQEGDTRSIGRYHGFWKGKALFPLVKTIFYE
jgi:hypothetical protein